jgi:type VI secretion system protein ImpH
MAAAKRDDARLIEELQKHGNQYGFFHAVSLLHRLAPDAVPVGGLGPVEKEAIRFRHDPSLVFSPSDVQSIQLLDDEGKRQQTTVTTTFLGLTGSVSPLANAMSEEVLRDLQDHDGNLSAFYDIFHHRLISLFFRSWKKYRFYSGFRNDGKDAFTQRALAFVGVDPHGASPRFSLPLAFQLSLAPLLAHRTRSARTLEVALRRVLPEGINVRIESFVERIVDIPKEQRIRLGLANTTLGEDFVVGRRVHDRSGRFRIHVGPVTYDRYEELLPGNALHAALGRIVDHLSRGTLEAELDVRVREDETPHFLLGDKRGALLASTTRLGGQKRKALRARILLGDEHADTPPVLLDTND